MFAVGVVLIPVPTGRKIVETEDDLHVGSALRGGFDENSDVDILVEFEPGHPPGLFALAAMERELEETIGRTVDLRTYHDLSRYFRDDVVASARVVYAA